MPTPFSFLPAPRVLCTQAGAGSATLSMAYAGYLFTEGVIKGLKGEEVTMCAYVESSITDAVHAQQSRYSTALAMCASTLSLSDTPLAAAVLCAAALHVRPTSPLRASLGRAA